MTFVFTGNHWTSFGRYVITFNESMVLNYHVYLLEMDALFETAPLFVGGTRYAKVEDINAAERELRNGG